MLIYGSYHIYELMCVEMELIFLCVFSKSQWPLMKRTIFSGFILALFARTNLVASRADLGEALSKSDVTNCSGEELLKSYLLELFDGAWVEKDVLCGYPALFATLIPRRGLQVHPYTAMRWCFTKHFPNKNNQRKRNASYVKPNTAEILTLMAMGLDGAVREAEKTEREEEWRVAGDGVVHSIHPGMRRF